MSVNNNTVNTIKAAPMSAPNALPPAGSFSILPANSVTLESKRDLQIPQKSNYIWDFHQYEFIEISGKLTICPGFGRES